MLDVVVGHVDLDESVESLEGSGVDRRQAAALDDELLQIDNVAQSARLNNGRDKSDDNRVSNEKNSYTLWLSVLTEHSYSTSVDTVGISCIV